MTYNSELQINFNDEQHDSSISDVAVYAGGYLLYPNEENDNDNAIKIEEILVPQSENNKANEHYSEIKKIIYTTIQDSLVSSLASYLKYNISLSAIHPFLKGSSMTFMAAYQFYVALQNLYSAPFVLASEIVLSVMLLNTVRGRAEASSRN